MKHSIVLTRHEYLKLYYGKVSYVTLRAQRYPVKEGDILHVKEIENTAVLSGNELKLYIADASAKGSAVTVSVKRIGSWLVRSEGMLACSLCGEDYPSGEELRKNAAAYVKDGRAYAYCPFCGAMMMTDEEIKELEKKDSEGGEIWA